MIRVSDIGYGKVPDAPSRAGRGHQQSGQCIYITNMQNMNPALFCILILGFAYYFAYCNIYMQSNMHNMQNTMRNNSAGFIFSIFCILKYAEYAEYAKEYATVCKTICKIC